jgi:DNA polymerase-3 subunit alpha
MHKVYIKRKRGEEPVTYQLPELQPILEPTYGVITYQEQVMRIAQVLGGISLAEADVLRKAVGKKDAELIKKELGKFITKAIAKGHGKAVIEDIAGQIETFGRYGFNKSHSVAYSVVAYHTAWLKAHHPADFMAALLSACIGDTDSVVKYINEARELGLEVLAPHVNESNYKFTVIGDKRLRFGFGAIRNVGRGAIDSILAARATKPFESLHDLAGRVDLRLCNKRVFEALITSGALDDLGGAHRAQLLAMVDGALQEAAFQHEERASGQVSLFGETIAGSDAPSATSTGLPNVAPMSESERLTREKEVLGFYISGHPLEPFRTDCELMASHTVAQLGTWQEGAMTLGVVITAIKKQVSKKSGAEFARMTVEDFTGTTELLVFPEAWAAVGDRVKVDIPVLIKGGYSRRDQGAETPTFIVETIQRFAEVRSTGAVAVSIELGRGPALAPDVMRDVRAVAEAHPGASPIEVRWTDGSTTSAARWRSRTLRIAATGAALTELRALLGQERVRLVRGS